MAIAIWPAAWLRKSTSSAVKVSSVMRTIIRSPTARPRFTSGIKQALFTPSAAASLYPSPPPGQPISSTVTTIGFLVSKARLAGSSSGRVMITSSLAKPLLTGASNAYSLNVPASWPGNQIPAPSQRIISRKLADIARRTSRKTKQVQRAFSTCVLPCSPIPFHITQVLTPAHFGGLRTRLGVPDRPEEVDAQRCSPERCDRREGGNKSHAHRRVGQNP